MSDKVDAKVSDKVNVRDTTKENMKIIVDYLQDHDCVKTRDVALILNIVI